MQLTGSWQSRAVRRVKAIHQRFSSHLDSALTCLNSESGSDKICTSGLLPAAALLWSNEPRGFLVATLSARDPNDQIGWELLGRLRSPVKKANCRGKEYDHGFNHSSRAVAGLRRGRLLHGLHADGTAG